MNANFEGGGTPVHTLDCTRGLDSGNGSIHVFGDHVTTVQAAAHVFPVARAPFPHLVGWLKARTGDICCRKLVLVAFSAEMTGAYVARGCGDRVSGWSGIWSDPH